MQHGEQPRRSSLALCRRRRCVATQQLADESEAFEVVNVEHATDRASELVVVLSRRPLIEHRHASKSRPTTTSAAVDVFELEPSLIEKRAEVDVACLTKLRDEPAPVDAKR